jgi:hypothetical protein
MSAVQAGGGKGAGQGSGSSAGKPGSSTKTQGNAGPKGAKAAQGRSGKPGGRPGGGGAKGKQGTTISAPPPRRFTPTTMALIAVGLVVVVVLVFVVVKVAGGGSSSNNTAAPTNTPADPVVVAKLTGVTQVTADTVAVPSGLNKPSVLQGQPPYTVDGKPAVLYIGGEFCPYCAAERWGLILALSRFGTVSGLYQTTSSPWDVHPATATFTFLHASYTSPYITYVGKEYMSNDTTGPGTHTQLMPLTSQEQQLWSKYSAHFGIGEGFPFIDIANKVFILGPTYDPTVLAGLTQKDIANALSDPTSPITQAIVGTANYISAGICSVTNKQPSPVCSSSAVTAASKDLGLS